MKRIFFSIPGKPVPQARHRTNRGRTYDPSAKDKQDFNLQSRRYAPSELISGPVVLYLVFHMPVPKSAPLAIKEAAIDTDYEKWMPCEVCNITRHNSRSFFHTKRPDVDNLLKLVKDALNGLMWKDDSQVQIGGAFKVYSHSPRTEVELFFEADQDERSG